MSPEAAARQKIDDLLVAAGWAMQDYIEFLPPASRGIALREVPLTSDRGDLLPVNRRSADAIKVKRERASFNERTRIVAEVERRLSVVEELETVVNANLRRLLRQPILQRAFSGTFTLATSSSDNDAEHT